MRIIVFFLALFVSSSLLAISNQDRIKQSVEKLHSINVQLLSNDESLIDSLLKEKADVLELLMLQLKTEKGLRLVPAKINEKQSFLESRIRINTERGHELAVFRDEYKLKIYTINNSIRTYLEYLIESSKNYQTIDIIVETSQKKLDANLKQEISLALPEVEGSLSLEVKKNHQLFLKTSQSYRDILSYVISNPREIASTHWFQEFSLLSAISYVNHFDILDSINNSLVPFKVDIGGITLSFLIYFSVYFCYPFVFNCTRFCVETYIIDKGVGQQELIYLEIRKPIRLFMIFFGINLGTYAFFYKTGYRTSLESFSFIIYSLIFIWLIFKIIDSIVLVQIEKIASSNKQLRKELFNLGVQVVKGLVVLIILAFALNHFGISLTAIMSTLGVGGFAFALAAKDTLSNLLGGITILFDNVFRMGDWIKVGEVEGTVAEIGLRSTTVRTFDNALITIPNSIVSVSSVMNWNRRAVGRRIKMHVGVTYESNMDDIRHALGDIKDMLKEHPGIANPTQKVASNKRSFKFTSQADTYGIKSSQLVFMDRYGDFSIDILIYCFARTVDWTEWLEVKEDILFKIAVILKNNNLEFAYPTQVRIHRSEYKDNLDGQIIKGRGI